MTVDTNTGVVDTSDRLATEIKQGSSNFLHLVDLDATPLLSLLRALPSAAAVQTQVQWNQKQHRPLFAALAASAESSDTSITVGTGEGDYFAVDDLVALFGISGTPEILRVTGITADDLDVTRSVGSAVASSAAVGAHVMILGPATAQGADIADALWVSAASGYNYTEIFRTPVVFTGTAAEIARFGSRKSNRDIAFALAEHYRRIEQTLFFGGRSYTADDGNGFPLGTMGGLVEFLQAATSVSGTLSATGFAERLAEAYAAGSKAKVIFAGPHAAVGLQTVYGVNFLPNSNDRKRFGIRPDWFVNTPYGLIPGFTKGEWHPSAVTSGFNATETSAAPGPASALFVVDTKHVRYRPLRDTSLEKNRQGPGEDKDAREWLTEASLEVSNSSAHLYVPGITG